MAQMLGLWVRRAPIGNLKRKILLSIFKPIMKYLIKIDQSSAVNFKEGQMITGLYCTAYKKS